jgi:hypothetical protein
MVKPMPTASQMSPRRRSLVSAGNR